MAIKRYMPDTIKILIEASSAVESADKRMADYLKSQAANITKETIKNELKKLDKNFKNWMEALKKLRLALASTNIKKLVESQLGILAKIEASRKKLQQMKELLEELPANEQKTLEKAIEKREKELDKVYKKTLETYQNLAKKGIPTRLKNLGDRILAFLKRRAPKGVKFNVKFSTDPLPGRGIVFGYHILLSNVPTYSDSKKKTKICLVFALGTLVKNKPTKDGDSTVEIDKVVLATATKEYTPLPFIREWKQQLSKQAIKVDKAAGLKQLDNLDIGTSWKVALNNALKKAAELDAAILPATRKIKVGKKGLVSEGFSMKGVEVKVDNKANIVVRYKINTHKDLKGAKPFDGWDVTGGKENPKPSKELITRLLLGITKDIGQKEGKKITTERLKLVKWELVPRTKEFVFYIRYIPIPDMSKVV